MLCTPTASALVAHCAAPALSATLEQPAIATPPSLNEADPVGALPVTVAVKVTDWPCVEGFSELASAVVVAVAPPPPPKLTCTSIELADALTTWMLTPVVLSVYVCPCSSTLSVKLPAGLGFRSRNCVSSLPLDCSKLPPSRI